MKFYGAEETTPQGFFTSACSPLIYRDVAWPAEFRGNLFVCDPAQNLVSRLRLEDDGPAYRARREPADEKSEFFAAADSWFRPMHLAHAPDGSVYVVDMYREFIEDFSAIPRFLQQQYNILNGRDRGRLWRLTHERAPKPPVANMAKLKDAQLVPELTSVHFWRRETARRLLIERNAKQASDLVAALLERGIQPAVASDPVSAEGLVNALYTLEGLGTIRGEHLLAALKHSSPDVKRQVLRIADQQFQRAGQPVEQLLLTDSSALGSDPRLLLQIALSLGQSRGARASTALANAARVHGSIRWMDAAIASSAHHREKEILAHLMSDVGASSEIIELLSAAVANRGDSTEIGETKLLVAKAADQPQRDLLRRILDAGLAEVRPEKVETLASFDPPSGEFLAAVEKETPKFLAALTAPRDPARGRELFREHCAACHVAPGLGASVGPNLDSERQRAEEIILRDILFPTETIRAGYETWQVKTTSGIEYHALLASESPTSLTFRLPAGQEVTVLRKKIARSESHKVSLMPSSYAQVLTPAEVADIIAFLRSN